MKILIITLYLFTASQGLANISMFETEPNNKPTEATLFSPPINILAAMQNSDQDLFLWNVTDAQSLYRWNIQLQGITERLTKMDIMQINFAEDGKGVLSVNSIVSIRSKNGLGKEMLSDLIFAPGKYYFAMSYAGSDKPSSGLLSVNALEGFDDQTITGINKQEKGEKAVSPSSYTLNFTKGKRLNTYNPNNKQSKESPVRITTNYNSTLFNQEQPTWAKFNITENEALLKWQLKGQVSLGNKVKALLYNGKDEMLAETTSSANGSFQFTDLSLPQGDYFIKLSSSNKFFITNIIKKSIGKVVSSQEAEPNDTFAHANLIKLGDTISGRMSKNREYDYFKFAIDEKLSSNNLAIRLQNMNQKKIVMCLINTTGRNSQCRNQKTDVKLNHISLTQGIYGIYVRGEADAQYSLSINAKGKRNPIMEVEPNDSYENASPMNAKNLVKGTFDANREFDYFSFNVDKEPQLWTIQANGEGIESIYIYNSASSVIQNFKVEKGNKRVRLSNLFLLPGKHVVAIRGSKGKYLLRAFATGKPDKNFESEPNDDSSRSMFLAFDTVRKGVLQNKTDRDFYHFNLNNKQHIKLTITPPVDGSITYGIYRFGDLLGKKTSKLGKAVSFEGIYPMGDYSIQLKSGKQTSVAHYRVELERLSTFECTSDCEPNDSRFHASIIPENGRIKGSSNTHGDADWYKLPILPQESRVRLINNLTENQGVRIYDKNGKSIQHKFLNDETNPQKPQIIQVTIPAHTESFYKIQSNDKPYDYHVIIDDEIVTAKTVKDKNNNVTINLQGLPKSIKAFYDYGQVLHGKALISNNSSIIKNLKLKSHASHHLWDIQFAKNSISLEPQSKTNLDFTIHVPNDVYTNRDQSITVAVIDEAGNSIEDNFLISAKADIQAVNPQMHWQLPQELLGGINVANLNFGAKRTEEDIARNTSAIGKNFDALFDGKSVTGSGVLFRGGRKTKKDTITVELAGTSASKIIGFALNPLSQRSPNQYPQDIEIQLSLDGLNFTTAITTKLKQVGIEQYFVLDEEQSAKYARLIIYNNYENNVNGVSSLGEFKVIASSDSLSITNPNIASPELGGNVIWAKPKISGAWDKSVLTAKKENTYAKSTGESPWQWVIGFHHQRAALIDSITWQPPKITEKRKTFEQVQIMASTQSPVGPWETIKEVALSTTQLTNIKLDKPTWARYLKFNVGSVKKRENRYFPDTIKIFEHRANNNYQSILGEWGDNSENAIYEKTFPHDFSQHKKTDLNNNSKQTAIDISQSQIATGFVQLEHADKPDWYKFKIPQGQNTLVIELSGVPTIRTIIHLEDTQGNKITETQEDLTDGKIFYTYKLTANEYYFIKVVEPPRNVIFTWDTSGSTSAYHSIIFNALQHFTNGVLPGRDEVNFQPFGGKLLMDKWYGEPYLLKTILNNYARNDNSSSAEEYLHESNLALKNKKGSKAIIVITDAIAPRFEKLWDSFKEVKPRVFSLGIITGNGFGGDDEWQTDLMQAWARVNHGQYNQVITGSQVEIAFERAAAKLREPANYQIKIESMFEKAKGAGNLRIIQDQKAANNSGAIELILDASGSMLKRLNGKRRINIAKEVLTKAVSEIIPAGTPVALRVFGNKQAGSCRTDLAIPLKPLDATKAASIIKSINAKNLAKTPIAESLLKVANDLKSNKGKKIVILVTDGEETCEGNPQEAIQQLIKDGIDIRLNIVGFAIDDKELKNQFQQWSSLGGGKYFDSNNPESLKTSVTQALQTPYSVYNLTGELISQGLINGNPVELPAGFYTIKVFADKVTTFEKYHIKGEENQVIEMK